jgi:hypothetical protein
MVCVFFLKGLRRRMRFVYFTSRSVRTPAAVAAPPPTAWLRLGAPAPGLPREAACQYSRAAALVLLGSPVPSRGQILVSLSLPSLPSYLLSASSLSSQREPVRPHQLLADALPISGGTICAALRHYIQAAAQTDALCTRGVHAVSRCIGHRVTSRGSRGSGSSSSAAIHCTREH